MNQTNIMITLFIEENNPITQNFYDNLINNLQFHQLCCPKCNHYGTMKIHGYYTRCIKQSGEKLCLTICRVKCGCCGSTHAILFSSIVPYSQISLSDHIDIIKSVDNSSSIEDVMNSNPSIDENNCHYIIRQYLKHWREKLLSENISFSDISNLVKSCFKFFSTQFMQIKNTHNILFSKTT